MKVAVRPVPRTIRECDQQLTERTEAYKHALDVGDLKGADTAYTDMDRLLELRYHLPQQRR